MKNKFTPANVGYAQDYLNFNSQLDPYKLRFFDEMALTDRTAKNAMDIPYVELARWSGWRYVCIDGASDTIAFLYFFAEAIE